jgi:hypothetical protein
MSRNFFMAVVVVSLVSSAAALPLFAADNSSFSIAPPPIANPVFGAGEGHLKVRGTYLSMESTDPTNDIEMNGYGFDFVGRTAFNNFLAIDGAIGILGLSGDMSYDTGMGSTDTTLSGFTMPMSFNLEVQPVKTNFINLILFAGPQLSFSYMDMDYTGGYTTTNSYVYGLQAGAQIGFNIRDTIGIDIFGMTLKQSGTADTYTYVDGWSPTSGSSDIPSYKTTSYGMDLEYIPWGLTLSSILQEAGKSDENGMKTHLYQLSWSHKF